jgi:hypothetical protein
LCLHTLPAAALGLGEITVESPLGKPLRAYIALIGAGDDMPDISCFQLVRKSASTDLDAPRLSNAHLSISGSGGKSRIVVTTSGPMNEPALVIPLHVGCNEDITKEYTILLDPAEYSPALPVVALKADIPAASVTQQTPAPQPLRTLNEWEIREGESLKGLARNIYPHSPKMRRTFITAIRRANPDIAQTSNSAPLPSGSLLKIPDLRTLAAESAPAPQRTAAKTEKPQPKEKPSLAQTAKPQDKPKTEVKKAPAPRLQIVTSPPPPAASTSKPGDTHKLDQQQQNQALLAQADDQVALIMSQKNRISGLEGQISALQGQLSLMQKQMEALQRTAPASAQKGLAVTSQSTHQPFLSPFWWGVASTAGMLALVMGLHYLSQRRRRQEPVYGYGLDSSEKEHASKPVAPQAKPSAPAAKSVISNELDMSRMDATPISAMTVGEINSVVEEADVYFSLGRPDEAITLLKDYIAFNPQLGRHPESKAKPWIKLLEIYHATKARAAFEELATRYHQKFNVRKPTWDTIQDNPASGDLEQFPHLIGLITSTWNSPSCKQYLQELISDNREGNRSGFSAGVFDDVLMLVGVLNHLEEKS